MKTLTEKARWRLWSLACRLPGICPANAHSALLVRLPGHKLNPRIDAVCRSDCAANGNCWCGRLREQEPA